MKNPEFLQLNPLNFMDFHQNLIICMCLHLYPDPPFSPSLPHRGFVAMP